MSRSPWDRRARVLGRDLDEPGHGTGFVVSVIFVMGGMLMLAIVGVIASGCGAFNGPANPPNAPWPVVCEGGARCPVDHICAAGGMCRPLGYPYGGARPERPPVPQRRPEVAP